MDPAIVYGIIAGVVGLSVAAWAIVSDGWPETFADFFDDVFCFACLMGFLWPLVAILLVIAGLVFGSLGVIHILGNHIAQKAP